MPSKSKKQSKSSSGGPNSKYSASPQTSALTSPTADLDIDEQHVRGLLEEASSRFPNLIGKSAFVGSVTDVRKSSRCAIWLSESSMVSCSISPGSVVSVSLAASRIRSMRAFPLTSFLDKLTDHGKVELMDETTSKVGEYFALATVFPSSEVAKNEVMLSSSLSYTMAYPSSGSVIFVYPVEAQPLSGLVYGNSKTNSFSIYVSSELFLELVPAECRAENNGDLKSRVNSFEDIHGDSENIRSLSPRTPLCQPKISSTPSHQSSAKHKAVSTPPYSNSSSVDLSDMKEALMDEDTKQIIQGCATSELYSRALLRGNLVAIPILSNIFFFCVVGINELGSSNDQDLVKGKSHNSVVDHFEGSFLVNHETKVHLRVPNSSSAETPKNRAGLENKLADTDVEYDVSKLGGLGDEYATLRDIISSSMKNTLSRFGLRTTKGVLLHGPPGTGKTTLARLCVRDAGVNLFIVNGPEIFSQYYGETEQAMQKIFHSASQAAPAVVFIDELDAVAPARAEGGEELSQRMVATLLNLMDGISRSDGLLVIAATNRPESIEPALRRPGRFDREIEIGVPSPAQRLDILQTILGDRKHSLSPIKIQQLALATHGFVGADLAALCNEAALFCLRRHAKSKEIFNIIHLQQPSILREDMSNGFQKTSDCLVGVRDISSDTTDSASSNGTELPNSLKIQSSSFCEREISEEMHDSSSDSTEALIGEYSLEVSFEDFEKAKLKVRPSAMREVILEVPRVNWDDVGGQVEVKNQLKEAVLWSQEYKSALKRVGVRPPTGILMFGPPGCSKTLMARAVASEANLNFLAVKGPELFSKWVGESEKAVRSLFAKARANAPSIIFFDEIDGLAVVRGKESDGVSVSDRVMSQLLVELDGLHQRVDVTVIAATNRPDKIDPALLRPGRFDRLLYVGPPNEIDREDIFRIHLRKVQCCSDVSIKELARLTEGHTGADISLICREAVTAAIEESSDASEIDISKVRVTMQHLNTAISQVEPSETHSYQELSNKFQRFVRTSNRGDAQKK